MPKTGQGPGGKGTTNLDSYQSDVPPMIPVNTAVLKIIVPTDKKRGPAKPMILGGASPTGGCPDCYWE